MIPYERYHAESLYAGDIDPSYKMLRYVCDRYELNMEQRYWLAFLYATCYCGPTVFYIYNEFPDYENVNEARLERWWKENKSRLLFQTDRQWIRSRDQFCDIFRSYKKIMGRLTQEQKFSTFKSKDPYVTYGAAWMEMSKVYQFGRFAMFLYLEAVQVVTGFPMKPKSMDMSEAESCRNGLAFAINRPDLNTHGSDSHLPPGSMTFLQNNFDSLVKKMESQNPENNVWNIETTLCAYKKYVLGKRYVGYYLDRQSKEISKMQSNVPEGVDWSVLWDYRKETYNQFYLKEFRTKETKLRIGEERCLNLSV